MGRTGSVTWMSAPSSRPVMGSISGLFHCQHSDELVTDVFEACMKRVYATREIFSAEQNE